MYVFPQGGNPHTYPYRLPMSDTDILSKRRGRYSNRRMICGCCVCPGLFHFLAKNKKYHSPSCNRSKDTHTAQTTMNGWFAFEQVPCFVALFFVLSWGLLCESFFFWSCVSMLRLQFGNRKEQKNDLKRITEPY